MAKVTKTFPIPGYPFPAQLTAEQQLLRALASQAGGGVGAGQVVGNTAFDPVTAAIGPDMVGGTSVVPGSIPEGAMLGDVVEEVAEKGGKGLAGKGSKKLGHSMRSFLRKLKKGNVKELQGMTGMLNMLAFGLLANQAMSEWFGKAEVGRRMAELQAESELPPLMDPESMAQQASLEDALMRRQQQIDPFMQAQSAANQANAMSQQRELLAQAQAAKQAQLATGELYL